jgi:predicted phosphodiesterase
MRPRSIQVCLIALLVLMIVAAGSWSSIAAQSSATPAASPVASPQAVESWPSWIQLGPNDAIVARAVRLASCPDIVIDGVTNHMSLRAPATANHPNVVCETTIPPGSDSVSIDGKQLALPVAEPDRIAIIGDTGCRLKAPDSFQACNDPSAWPFARTAATAAAWDPDLVIHAGDYIYRESPCPDGNAGCAGSPYGDTWDTWNADFFTPAAALLDTAPWILVRGNHEDCSREGEGWFRYLDAGPVPQECQPYTKPWALSVGGVRAVVLDSASAQDTTADETVTKAFEPIFEQAVALAGDGPAWLLTHKPFWSIGAGSDGQPTEWSTATYNQSGFAERSDAFDLVIAGHVHMSQLLWFTPESKRAPQLIAGDGGTELDDMATGMFDGAALSDPELVQGWRWQDFGFMTIQPVDTGFVAGVRLLDGTNLASCLSVATQLTCLPK